MKQIVLAKRLHRIIAAFIDMIILTAISAVVFFTLVYPNAFDAKTYSENQKQVVELYRDSQLFVCTDDGNYAGKSTFSYNSKLEKLYDNDIEYEGSKFEDNCLTKDLFLFYTTLYKDYGAQANLTFDGFCGQILKTNTVNSNIASFDPVTYKITMIDDTKESETVAYFLSCYEVASKFVINSTVVNKYVTANQKLMGNAIVLFIPVAAGVSLLTMLLMPMLMPHGQTLGKLIFGIGVLDKNGYKLKKGWYVARWLVYISAEYILSFITFGGAFLISFTMFQFAKKRRCLHDMLSNSVVVNLKESLFFNSKEEEVIYKKYLDKYKNE